MNLLCYLVIWRIKYRYFEFVSIAKRKIINFFLLRDYFMLDTILFSQNRLSYGKVRPVLHFRERCPYKPSLKNVNEIVVVASSFCCKISLNTNVLKKQQNTFLWKNKSYTLILVIHLSCISIRQQLHIMEYLRVW